MSVEKNSAVGGQAINVRRFDHVIAITTKHRLEIIYGNEENIGLFRRFGRLGRSGEEDRQANESKVEDSEGRFISHWGGLRWKVVGQNLHQ